MSVAEGGAPPAEPVDHRAHISLDWLVRLRWGAVVGQAATIGAAEVMFGHLPLARLFSYVGALAATNLVLAVVKNRTSSARLLCGAHASARGRHAALRRAGPRGSGH